MFSQLFGKYLIENDVINEGQFDDILAKMEQTRAKLGLIAVSEGILTKEKAEEINILQTQKDARFGDIAVEEGYITKEQSDTDKREYHLKLTDKYYDYLNLSQAYISKVSKRIEERFNDEELEILDRVLDITSHELMSEIDIPDMEID